MTGAVQSFPPRPNTHRVAAVDLGSNSFHMVLGSVNEGQIVVVDRMKEMVQLGAGLDGERRLSPDAQERALGCLERFGAAVRGLPAENVRVVGTNTLRVARDAESFLARAEQVLGHSIEIISGIEEARLIYSGVVRDRAQTNERLLIVDIGGGSTELVIGEGATPLDLESLYVGSIALMKRHFDDGKINAKRFRRAEVTTLQELERVQERFKRLGWGAAIGASGTVRAVARVVRANGFGNRGITRDSLRRVRDAVIEMGSVEALSFNGLSRARATVFAGGLAVLCAIFESLDVEVMEVSNSALREGLLNDLLGRFLHRDVRSATVDALMGRYHVDKSQAERVEATVRRLLRQVTEPWNLPIVRSYEMCGWAARLHEIGLDIAHSQYHKHGAYVLENADMPGFSRQEQRVLSALVRAHRRRFPSALWKDMPGSPRVAEHLAVVLRLAVLLHRSRGEACDVSVSAGRRSLTLRFPPNWLEAHPLAHADLLEEAELLKAGGFELNVPLRGERS